MTQIELRNKINEKKVPHFMVWNSKSKFFNLLYIDKIKELYKLNVEYLYEIEDLERCKKASFDDMLYIIVSEQVRNAPGLAPRNFLIVISENITSEQKNAFGDNLVGFFDFDSDNIGSVLKDNYPLNTKQAKTVAGFCKNDLYKCMLELDKVKELDGNFIDNLNMLTKEDLMDFDIPFNVYAFAGSVINKGRSVIEDMKDFVISGQNVIGFLTLLYNSYKNILQIKEQPYLQAGEIERCTGIKSNTVYAIKNSYNINSFGTDYLLYKIKSCSSLISGIKKGIYTEEEAFDYACLL